MSGKLCILNFHGIGRMHAGVDDGESAYWITEDQFRDAVSRAARRRDAGYTVTFTFDDGNLSDLEIAAPILQDHNFQAAFFVLTGRIGTAHYLDAANMQSLRSMGMEIGLHGRDHVDWRRLDADGLAAETQIARQELADCIGAEICKVAIPFGAYNRRIIARLTAAGFERIYTSDGGHVAASARVQSRTSLRADMSGSDIDAILEGRGSIRAAARRKLSTFLRRNVI